MDIKPENILVKNNDIRTAVLTDFGSSINEQPLKMGEIKHHIWSLGFAAPEIFTGGYYNPSPCDYWSIGCVLIEMLWGMEGV